jgi:hypothetical protein
MLVLGVIIAASLTLAIWAAWKLVALYVEDSVRKADHSREYQELPVAVFKPGIRFGNLSISDPALLERNITNYCWSEDF